MTINLDHAATTRVRQEVVEAMMPYFTEDYGNPSGSHGLARQARRALDRARDVLGEVLGCEPGEIIFTSGGTESDNLAVTGVALGALAREHPSPLVCCSAIEHPAVLAPVRFLGGVELPVDRNGIVDLETLDAVLAVEQERVVLVSVMTANNETGVMEPIGEIAGRLHDAAPDALLHTDAVQALAWVDLAGRVAQADLVTVTAHKIGGPKGIGALVARPRARGRLSPLLRGGPQEHELRAGTQNVAGIVGFAAAAELVSAEREAQAVRISALRDELAEQIRANVPDAEPTLESGTEMLPSILNIGFRAVEPEELLYCLDSEGVQASAGSSCASGALEASPVLRAMGVGGDGGRGYLRFSLGYETTSKEVSAAASIVSSAVARLRRP